MNRRILGIVVAVVLAAVGTGVLTLYVKGAEDRALAGERTVDVLVVQAPIKKGTPAEELVGLVESKRVPAKVQATDAIGSLEEVAGRITAVDLVAGEQLVDARFVKPGEVAVDGDVEIPEDLQLVTVSLEPNRVLGGELRPGNKVGVIASFADASTGEGEAPPQPEGGQATHFILHKVLVAKILGEPQPATPEPEPESDEETPARVAPPAANLLVTLAVDAPSAERLVFAAEYGTLWLSLQSDSTSQDNTRIQTKDTIYR